MMSKNKKIYAIVGVLAIVLLATIVCLSIKQNSKKEFYEAFEGVGNVASADFQPINSSVKLVDLMQVVKNSALKNLKGVADKDANSVMDLALYQGLEKLVAISGAENLAGTNGTEQNIANAESGRANEYSEVWLFKPSAEGQEIFLFNLIKSRADMLGMSENISMKMQDNIVIAIISTRTQEIENAIDKKLKEIDGEAAIFTANVSSKVSENITMEDEVKLEVAVDKKLAKVETVIGNDRHEVNDSQEDTEIEHSLQRINEELEHLEEELKETELQRAEERYNERKERLEREKQELIRDYTNKKSRKFLAQTAELEYDESNKKYSKEIELSEGENEILVMAYDENGNVKCVNVGTVTKSSNGITDVKTKRNADGSISVNVQAVEGGEICISTVNEIPDENANWQKYEAGKTYTLEDENNKVKSVYVFYRANTIVTEPERLSVGSFSWNEDEFYDYEDEYAYYEYILDSTETYIRIIYCKPKSDAIEFPTYIEHESELKRVAYIGNIIDDNIFEDSDYKTIRYMTLPKGLFGIGDYAFYFKENEATPTAGDAGGIELTTYRGFVGNLVIPESVEYIGTSAFEECRIQGDLVIPDNVVDIMHWAFFGNGNIEGTLKLGKSIEYIGEEAFSRIGSNYIDVDKQNGNYQDIDGILFSKDGTTLIQAPMGMQKADYIIPSSVTSIGSQAFYGCSGFTGNLTIPNSVMSIGEYAFSGCSGFTGSLTIPDSVTSIEGDAFSGCSGLDYILFLNTLTIPINSNSYRRICNLKKLYALTSESATKYNAVNYWNKENNGDGVYPVLMVNKLPEYVLKGSTYTETGVTTAGFVTDPNGLFRTLKSYKNNATNTESTTLDTSTVGTYTATYTLQMKNSSGNYETVYLSDGETPETVTRTIKVISQAPYVEDIYLVSPTPGKYGEGTEITLAVKWNQNVMITVASELKLKFGENGAERDTTYVSTTDNISTYKYTIANGDAGKLMLVSYGTGYVNDNYARDWISSEVTFDDEIIAVKPQVTLMERKNYKENVNGQGTVYYVIGNKDRIENGAYRADSIKSIIFSSGEVPETYVATWDLSYNSGDGTVTAYLERNNQSTDTTTYYNLHIVADLAEGEKIFAPADSSYLFAYYTNCVEIKNLHLLDTSKVTDMGSMFSHCEKLESLDVSNFDTSKVMDMSGMFRYCTNLQSILLGKDFDKLNGTYMFTDCINLKAIITQRAITPTVTVPTLGTDTGLNNSAILYVPNEASETAYEAAENYATVFGADRVRPILELVGDNPAYAKFGGTYVDAGVTVAGMNKNTTGNTYTPYGYTVSGPVITSDVNNTGLVDTIVPGEYRITYTIYDSSNTAGMSVTRIVEVYSSNYTDGTNYYETLNAAFSNATSGSTITVLKDVTETAFAEVESGKSFVLDLNGKTITVDAYGTNYFYFIHNSGNLEVKDSKGNGKINLTVSQEDSTYGTSIFTNWEGNLTITSGTYDITGTIGYTYTVRNIDGTLNINGGTIIARATGSMFVAAVEPAGGNLNITGGTIRAYDETNEQYVYGVVNAAHYSANIKITGGDIYSDVNGVELTKHTADSGVLTSTLEVSGSPIIEGGKYGIDIWCVTGNVQVKSGTIKGGTAGIYQRIGKIKIGDSSDKVSTTSPVIQGGIYGVDAQNSFEFYDGILKGKTSAYSVEPDTIPTGYGVYNDAETIDGEEYKTAYLAPYLMEREYIVTSYSPGETVPDLQPYQYKTGVDGGTIFVYSMYAIGAGKANKTQYTSDKIKNITIVDNINIPSGADSWDASMAQDGSIMAWVVANGEMYNLYIGSNGKMFTPANSFNLFAHYINCESITGLQHIDTRYTTSMRRMFGVNKVSALDLSGFNTENVETMSYMFRSCENLTELNLDSFKTGKLKEMESIFNSCSNLENISWKNIDTTNVTNMSGLFANCSKLSEIDLSNFKTEKVTNMQSMFLSCKSLSKISVNKFNTSNVTNMSHMFRNCESLTELDVSNFDTSNVTDMSYMFVGCTKLTDIDLSNFDTRKVTNVEKMFKNDYALKTIHLGSNFDKINGFEMFTSCTNLTAIIAKSTTPMTLSTDVGVESLTKLYVPTSTAETAYEGATYYISVFGADRIQPILELVGESQMRVPINYNYIEKGVTVAGMNKNSDDTYTPYGYTVSGPVITSDVNSTGLVDTIVLGEYRITYTIYDSSNTAGMSVTRIVEVYSSNYTDGTNYYETLKEAFDNANSGSTITVLKDVTESTQAEVESGKSFVLDLNGKTITFNDTTYDSYIYNCGNLEVKDSSNSGKIVSTFMQESLEGRIILLNENGNLTITSGTYNLSGNNGWIQVIKNSSGTLNVNGGTLIAKGTNSESVGAIVVNAGDVNITGGIIKAYDETNKQYVYGVVSSGYGSANIKITGGDIYGDIKGVDLANHFGNSGVRTSTLEVSGNTLVEGGKYGIEIDGAIGNVQVKSGTIKGGTAGIYQTTGKIKIGDNSDKVSTTLPVIQGGTYGVYSTNNFNFYDGILKGKTSAYSVEPDTIPTGYEVYNDTETIDGEEYKTAYLVPYLMERETQTNDKGSYHEYMLGAERAGLTQYTSDLASSITLHNTINIPNGAENWDVSLAEDESIMAWLISDGNGKYELHIGADIGENGKMLTTWNASGLFAEYNNCISINNLKYLDTSYASSMFAMFGWCYKLQSLDLSGFDTSKVMHMNYMFASCTSLETLDVSSFDTSNVIKMEYMFNNCTSLESLNLGANFDTSNVTIMQGMFYGCSKLNSIDVNGFNTTKVTDMSKMFQNCNGLKTLDVSGFNTSKVTDMSGMFGYCEKLESLDVSNFDTSKVMDMSGMFRYCTNLQSILLGKDFDKLNGTYMFTDCINLRAIITQRAITPTVTVPTLGTDTGLNNSAILYVPNEASETAYEAAENYATVFGADRVRPILELVGESQMRVPINYNYIEKGVTVAGMNKNTTGNTYTPYGYTVSGPVIKKNNVTVSSVDTSTAGTYTLTYTVHESGETADGMSVTRTVNVLSKDISTATVDAIPNYVYTGSDITPEPVVKFDGVTLNKGKDYTVDYENNVDANEGEEDKAKVVIKGMGDYSGEVIKKFEIEKRKITIKPIDASKVYDGNPLTSNVYEIISGSLVDGHILRITMTGSQTEIGSGENIISQLTIVKDGEVDVTGNYNITKQKGTLTVTGIIITGSVEITGTLEVGSELVANTIEITPANCEYEYKWYVTEENSTTGGTLIEGESGDSYIVKDSDIGKYIYVEVTVKLTSARDTIFKDITDAIIKEDESSGEIDSGDREVDVESKNISGEDISIVLNPTTYVYDGNLKTPDVKVYDKETLLVLGTDYTLSFVDNRNVGTATAIITGINSYTGVRNEHFTITASEIDGKVTITGNNIYGATLTANTDAITPDGCSFEYQWYYNDTNSTEGGTAISGATNKDYKIDEGLVGKYIYVEVTASKDNYNSKMFKVITDADTNGSDKAEGKDLESSDITAELPDGDEYIYDGNPKEPKPIIKDGDKVLEEGKDYTVDYEDNIDANEGEDNKSKVIITGSGDYSGKITEKFEITKRKITIKPLDAEKDYDGTALTSSEYELISGSLVAGHKLTITTTGSQTEIGSGENTISTLTIVDDNGKDVKPNYNITTEKGILTVKGVYIEGNVEITGVTRVGKLLVANVIDVTPAGCKFTYKWYVSDTNSMENGTLIEGENEIGYIVRESDLGKYIYVEVTAKRSASPIKVFKDITDEVIAPSGTTGEVDSGDREVDVLPVISGKVVITGDNVYGSTLTANTDNVVPNDCNLTYQWYYSEYGDGTDMQEIVGATNKTYVVGDNTEESLIGKYIYVKVHAEKENYSSADFIDVTDAENNKFDKVEEKDISSPDVTITLDKDEFTYDGTEHTPDVVVKHNGKTLEEGKDYEINYKNNIDAGSGEVEITGKGNYEGTVIKEFKIKPMEISVPWGSNTEFVYNGNPQAPSVGTAQGAKDEKIYFERTTKVNAGEYTSKASIEKVVGGREKAENYTLINDTKDYKITKATATLTLSSYSVEVVEGNKVKVTYEYVGDGAISYTEIDRNIATFEVKGKEITITGVKEGTTTLKLTANGKNYTDVTATINIKVLSANYTVTNGEDSTNYEKLQDAIDAAESGDTIIVNKDVTEPDGATVDKDITIDLKDKTITTEEPIVVKPDAEVTIVADTNDNGETGTIKNPDGTAIDNEGTINIGDESGDRGPVIDGNDKAIDSEDGDFNFNDGKLIGDDNPPYKGEPETLPGKYIETKEEDGRYVSELKEDTVPPVISLYEDKDIVMGPSDKVGLLVDIFEAGSGLDISEFSEGDLIYEVNGERVYPTYERITFVNLINNNTYRYYLEFSGIRKSGSLTIRVDKDMVFDKAGLGNEATILTEGKIVIDITAPDLSNAELVLIKPENGVTEDGEYEAKISGATDDNGIGEYQWEIRKDGEDGWEIIGNDATNNSTSYISGAVEEEGKYYIRVKVSDLIGNSTYSNMVSFTYEKPVDYNAKPTIKFSKQAVKTGNIVTSVKIHTIIKSTTSLVSIKVNGIEISNLSEVLSGAVVEGKFQIRTEFDYDAYANTTYKFEAKDSKGNISTAICNVSEFNREAAKISYEIIDASVYGNAKIVFTSNEPVKLTGTLPNGFSINETEANRYSTTVVVDIAENVKDIDEEFKFINTVNVETKVRVVESVEAVARNIRTVFNKSVTINEVYGNIGVAKANNLTKKMKNAKQLKNSKVDSYYGISSTGIDFKVSSGAEIEAVKTLGGAGNIQIVKSDGGIKELEKSVEIITPAVTGIGASTNNNMTGVYFGTNLITSDSSESATGDSFHVTIINK